MKDLLIGLGLLSCPAAVFVVFGLSGFAAFDESANPRASALSVQQGATVFAEACARCHGRTARGGERGPDLIQPIYGLALRSDAQLRQTILEGRRTGRRGYEDMPAANLPEIQVDQMIAFLREVQRIEGIR